MTTPSETSLYERLGGYGAIAAFVDDLMPRLFSDPQLGVYWRGQSNYTKRNGRQLFVDFLVAAFGGPAFYRGPDMKTIHEGLSISESDWEVLVPHVVAVLDKLGVQSKEKEEVLAAAASLKGDILET